MATKTTTKKPAAEDAPAKGPGVIASIEEFLRKATKEKPITKDDIVARLTKRFPDRDPVALGRTCACQVPGRMAKERKLNVVKAEEGGFYIKK